jgi:peptidoglycan/xylan/chitin deacetylase (PgdA/CDA1 family)
VHIPGIRKLRRGIHRVQKRFAAKSLILMYHRVADVELDPWSICVTPQQFGEQLEVLQEYANPISLKQFIEAHQNGGVPHGSVVITFDDGYADNLHYAKPLLECYNLPATIFISTGYIGQGQEFWWDELERLLLRPGQLPEQLDLKIDGIYHRWELGDAANYCEEDYWRDRNQRAWDSDPNSRMFFYFSVWQKLRLLSDSDRRTLLDNLSTWVGDAPVISQHTRSLSPEELTTLGQGNLIEIGAHTVTHPCLSLQPKTSQQDEIQRSKAELETLLNRPVTSFSYPFGDYTAETVELTRSAGFVCACSTAQESIWRHSDRFELPRLAVQNWNREDFRQQLVRWLHD